MGEIKGDENLFKETQQPYYIELLVLTNTGQCKKPEFPDPEIQARSIDEAKLNSYHYVRDLERRGYLENSKEIWCYLRNHQNKLLKKYLINNNPPKNRPY